MMPLGAMDTLKRAGIGGMIDFSGVGQLRSGLEVIVGACREIEM